MTLSLYCAEFGDSLAGLAGQANSDPGIKKVTGATPFLKTL
jgi:hypothetical protein